MDNTNWLRQTKEPLFPDVLWSRPENKRFAGKLLIIGGHKQSFNTVSGVYATALKAGIGTARVLLPQALQNTLKTVFPEAEYAPSNKIGSFSHDSLAALLEAAEWADGVLLAGDFGKNSETAILLDSFAEKYGGLLALAGDSLDYFTAQAAKLTRRSNTLIIAELGRLQKLAAPSLIQQNADLSKVIGQISNWTSQTGLAIVTEHSKQLIVAYQQQISTTPVKHKADDPALSACATVWLLQQPEKPFEALTTAAYCLSA